MNRQPHALATRPRRRARFHLPRKSRLCGRRRCDTYDEAIAYVLWLSTRTSRPLRIEDPCPLCDGWHVTSRRPTEENPT